MPQLSVKGAVMMLKPLTDASGAQVLQGFKVPRSLLSYDTLAERFGRRGSVG